MSGWPLLAIAFLAFLWGSYLFGLFKLQPRKRWLVGGAIGVIIVILFYIIPLHELVPIQRWEGYYSSDWWILILLALSTPPPVTLDGEWWSLAVQLLIGVPLYGSVAGYSLTRGWKFKLIGAAILLLVLAVWVISVVGTWALYMMPSM